MDQRLKEIVDNFDKMKIGLDDTFKFHCDQCGRCCINREDILLTPKDLFNIAKELGLTIAEAFMQYCEVYPGMDSKMPIVRLRPKGSIKRCPLLKDRKCSVHRAKPAVCALFPLGRCVAIDASKKTPKSVGTAMIQYILNRPGCGDDSETHTVREWLSDFNIPVEDEYAAKWYEVMLNLSPFLITAEKRFLEEKWDRIWTMCFILLYCQYDTSKDFMPQFERNVDTLWFSLEPFGYKE